ncbi:MAG: hypothetical protein M0D57_03540 [Sphingobacteriales bacterium JAD_PAG50586_3]|nr:MAG: hypothetical protein M0D57_03540 [Sphingobacteriales bacterium JAD_PAG50586_3]
MKQKTLILFLIIFALTTSGLAIWYFVPFKVAENLDLECHNMQYACGDCYEQEWRVIKFHNCYGKNSKYDSLIGTDIIVHYEKELDDKIAKEKCQSIICYDYFFHGDLYYSPYKGYILESTISHYKIREDCCIGEIE